LAGPTVLFSLNPSAGPTRQLHTFFLSPRETAAPAPAPVRRSAAATPAPPLRRRSHSTAPPPARAHTPLLRCCSAAARAPTPRLCHPRAAALRRRRPLPTRAASPAPICLPHSCIQDRFDPSTLGLSARKVFEELPLRLSSSTSSRPFLGLARVWCCLS